MIELTNYMEHIVMDKIQTMLPTYRNCCQCEDCQRDIAIMVLNRVPPKYVSSEKGEIFARIERSEYSNEVQVISEVAKAIEIVQSNPRHAKIS